MSFFSKKEAPKPEVKSDSSLYDALKVRIVDVTPLLIFGTRLEERSMVFTLRLEFEFII
jgi:hypothetical protein